MGCSQPGSKYLVAVQMTSYPVHELCGRIHARTSLYEMDVKHWLRDLDELKMRSFSRDTEPMLQLMADARTLQNLADMLVSIQCILTQP